MSAHKDTGEPRAARHGLSEYLIVLALLCLAAVGAVAVFGDNLRALFGIAPPRAAAPAASTSPTSR